MADGLLPHPDHGCRDAKKTAKLPVIRMATMEISEIAKLVGSALLRFM
jgi:hypothetical protein